MCLQVPTPHGLAAAGHIAEALLYVVSRPFKIADIHAGSPACTTARYPRDNIVLYLAQLAYVRSEFLCPLHIIAV
jgi:hypothetical protein